MSNIFDDMRAAERDARNTMMEEMKPDYLQIAKECGAAIWRSYKKENCNEVEKVDFTPEQLTAYSDRIAEKTLENAANVIEESGVTHARWCVSQLRDMAAEKHTGD